MRDIPSDIPSPSLPLGWAKVPQGAGNGDWQDRPVVKGQQSCVGGSAVPKGPFWGGYRASSLGVGMANRRWGSERENWSVSTYAGVPLPSQTGTCLESDCQSSCKTQESATDATAPAFV